MQGERFYRRQFPVVDEVVMVKILSVTDLGATCCLLEYNDIEGLLSPPLSSHVKQRLTKRERKKNKIKTKNVTNTQTGFIASSDYSRKRIRSVKKLMRVGKQEVLQVLRVDEDKGYVDLSKKLLTPKDIEVCSERFEKAKIVNGILRRLSEMRKVPVRDLYEQFGWGLFEVC